MSVATQGGNSDRILHDRAPVGMLPTNGEDILKFVRTNGILIGEGVADFFRSYQRVKPENEKLSRKVSILNGQKFLQREYCTFTEIIATGAIFGLSCCTLEAIVGYRIIRSQELGESIICAMNPVLCSDNLFKILQLVHTSAGYGIESLPAGEKYLFRDHHNWLFEREIY